MLKEEIKFMNNDVERLNQLLLTIKWKSSYLDSIDPQLTNEQKELIDLILLLIPEWKRLVGCQQHKTHDYTLDIHTLLVMARISTMKEYEAMDEYYKLVIMYSALLHDIAKLENIIDPNHPTKSALMASDILPRLGFSKEFTEDTISIIKRHQYFGLYAANRLCINIPEFAGFFNKSALIDILAALALADIKSVKRNEGFITRDIKNNIETLRYNLKRFLASQNSYTTTKKFSLNE